MNVARPGYCPFCGPADLLAMSPTVVERCAQCKRVAFACDTPAATDREVLAFVSLVPQRAVAPRRPPPVRTRHHRPCLVCGTTESPHKYYPGSQLCNTCYQRRQKAARR